MYDMPRKTPVLNEIFFALFESGEDMTAKQIADFINRNCRLPYKVHEHNISKCVRRCKENNLVDMHTKHKPYIFTLK